jgi:putative spermidine/putrescine transport system permease protein
LTAITPLLIVPVVAFLAVFYVFPLGAVLALGIWDHGFTFKYLGEALANAAYLRILLWTLQMAAVTAVICLFLGYPVAFVLARATPRTQAVMFALIILPFWTSSLVRAFAWITLLGRGGLLNQALIAGGVIDEPLKLVFNALGMYVGTVHIMLPYMIFSLYAAMRSVDARLARAAETLGASPLRAFFWTYFPLSMPGVISGVTLVFMITVGFFITPALLGGLRDATYVMLIEKQLNEILNWPLAAALSTVLLVITLTIFWVFSRIVGPVVGSTPDAGERQFANATTATRGIARVDHALRPLRSLLSRWRKRPGSALVGATWRSVAPRLVHWGAWTIVALLFIPIAIIVVAAFSPTYNLQFPPRQFSLQWFEKYFTRTEWVAATTTSFQVATMAGSLATVLALLSAYAMLRFGRRLQTATLTVLLSPLVVPAMVFAVGTYYQFAAMGLLGTKVGLALAHSVLALPAALLVILPAVQSVDASYERAAASLGANAWRTLLYVSLPLIRPAIVSGALLAFLTSFDEVVVAIFVAGSRAVTLPKKMYESVRFDTDPTITAASAVLIGLTVVVLLICTVLQRRAGARAPRLA